MFGKLVSVLIDSSGTYVVGILSDLSPIVLTEPARLVMSPEGTYELSKFSVIKDKLVVPDGSIIAYGLAADKVAEAHTNLYPAEK